MDKKICPFKKSQTKKPTSRSVFSGVFEGGFVFFSLMASMGIILRNGLDGWIGLDNGNKDPQNYYSL